MTTGLPERLRHDTRALHTDVERSHFMRLLLRGQLPLRPYCQLLRNLHALYETLEQSLLAQAGHPQVAMICLPPLFRTRALAVDLDTLFGIGWRSELQLQAACHAYLRRLQEVQSNQPELLIAHAYVRYLGDLSGGQQLKRIVARSLNLAHGHGTAFYDFGDTDQTMALTKGFRAGLAAVAVNPGQVEQIVVEARDAFLRHGALFHELALASGLQTEDPITNR